ncbi:hypothetical protein Tco_0754153 [Tanacetum coccineum]
MLSYHIRIMDPNSSLGRICFGDDVIIIASDKAEGSRDWNFPEYQDTTVSKGKKVMNALSEALKEKEDPGAFIFPIRLEGKVNENALADTGSDINTMPYRIFETLGREDMKKVDRGITMIDHTQAEAIGKLSNTSGTHDGEAISSQSKRSRNETKRLGLYQAVELEEDGFNVYFEGGLRSDDIFNATDYWLSISREENLCLSRSHTSTIRNPILRTSKWICECSLGYCKIDEEERSWDSERESNLMDLDTTTLRDLINSDDLYDRMGHMEICQDAIEQMEYRQSYHWDRYHGVFEHMAGVYSVPLLGAYNPPGYAQPQYDQYY